MPVHNTAPPGVRRLLATRRGVPRSRLRRQACSPNTRKGCPTWAAASGPARTFRAACQQTRERRRA